MCVPKTPNCPTSREFHEARLRVDGSLVVAPRLASLLRPWQSSSPSSRLSALAFDRAPPSNSRSSRCATNSPSTSGALPVHAPRSPIDCYGRGYPEPGPAGEMPWSSSSRAPSSHGSAAGFATTGLASPTQSPADARWPRRSRTSSARCRAPTRAEAPRASRVAIRTPRAAAPRPPPRSMLVMARPAPGGEASRRALRVACTPSPTPALARSSGRRRRRGANRRMAARRSRTAAAVRARR